MTFKSNGKKKSQDAKAKEKKSTPQDDMESLQITFYEIESWIEKTSPVLTRMTKELDKASTHFGKRRKESHQEQQLTTWKRNNWQELTLSEDETTMQWRLSFQPGNLLRVDTNITSVEQLIKAVQSIRLLQEQENSPQNSSTAIDDDDHALDLLLCSSSQSTHLPQDASSVEYWQYALGRRPKIHLENYNHYQMNLNYLTKDISSTTLNYIGQLYWDCLHPKFFSDWTSFWDRSDNSRRTQACIDSGLAMVFLHVIRHDKDISHNSQNIAGFYYDRARDELTHFFDEEPDFSTVEALLNLSMFCTVCKQLSQARIYISLCIQICTASGFHRPLNLPTNDLMLGKKYIKLIAIMYYNDWTLSMYKGETPLINDEDFDINFHEIITLNNALCELNETKDPQDRIDFDNNKTIVKETYFVHTIELIRLTKRITLLIQRSATVKQLLAEEKNLEEWYDSLPAILRNLDYDFQQLEQRYQDKVMMDADTLQAQASLLLKIQYESQWIILHKAILSSIRQSKGTSASLSGQEARSNAISSHSADIIIQISEIITRCFGWCVCQQVVVCLYHASTVYCRHALLKGDRITQQQAKLMIHRIMRILEAGSLSYQGFPEDMTECLCEFLKMHGMHNNLDCCSCKSSDDSTTISTDVMTDTSEENPTMFHPDNLFK